MVKFYRERNKSFTDIKVVSDKGDSDREAVGLRPYPAATLTMLHEHERPNFDTTKSSTWNAHKSEMESRTEYRDIGMAANGTRTTSAELFQHNPAQIVGLFADPSMQAHVPTLLGVAAHGHQDQLLTRGLPAPDASLSRYSSPMVQKLRSKGAPIPVTPGNPDSHISNNITRRERVWDNHPDHNDPYEKLVPDHELRAGKTLIRNVLRPQKAAPAASPAVTDGYRSGWQDDASKPRQLALFSGRQLAQAQHGIGPIASAQFQKGKR